MSGRTKRPKSPRSASSIPWLSDEELRRDLTARPHAELVDFLVDLIHNDAGLRARYHGRSAVQDGAPTGAIVCESTGANARVPIF